MKSERTLLVEPDRRLAGALKSILESNGFEVEVVDTLDAATRRLGQARFVLVVAEERLPDGRGRTLLRLDSDDRPPVVLLAPHVDDSFAAAAFDGGVLDAVATSGSALEGLGVRLRHRLEAGKARADQSREVRALRGEVERLKEMLVHDPLTGLLNRRGFDEMLGREVERARRHQSELALVSFDLDLFKRVNDERGHAAGDLVLSNFARILKREARRMDVVARLGGDEFSALLPSASFAGALGYGERVRSDFARRRIPVRELEIPGSVSAGVALLSRATSVRMLVEQADQGLYLAKSEGGNSVRSVLELPEGEWTARTSEDRRGLRLA